MTEEALEGAPLLSLPQAPMPSGTEAYFLRRPDGRRVRTAFTPAEGEVRGTVVLSPGRTEPIEKYGEVLGELKARGFGVLVHDWRGQGRSDRELEDRLAGHAKGWRPFLADYGAVLEAFKHRLVRPLIAVGHSMGGGLTALHLAEGPTPFAGVILSAPMLDILTAPRSRRDVERLARVMSLLGRGRALAAPHGIFDDERFETNILTHDRTRWERARAQLIAEPDLRLGGVTLGWLAFAFALARRVRASRRIEALDIPVTALAAGEERLVDNAAIRSFCARLKRGRYIEVEGAYHELLMETDPVRARFWTAFDALAAEIAPARASAA